MDDLRMALLVLSVVDMLGNDAREETARQLIDPATSESVMADLLANKPESLPGWNSRPRARKHLKDGKSRKLALDAIARCRLIGARLIFRIDDDYPANLLHLEHPPILLYVRGDSRQLHAWERSVAVVGTRSPTELGRRFARRSARELAAGGLIVVSGLALGTDAAAHIGALDANGVTVAVLASGVDEFTPRANGALGRRILERGAVVSERPPGTPVRPWVFTARNRIIAAMAANVVMLEAAVGSGSTITAESALELDRQLWVLPGRPGDPSTAGGLELLDYAGVRVFHGSGSVIAAVPAADVTAVEADRLGGELLELAWQIAGHLPCRFDQLPKRLGVVDRIPALLAGVNLLKLKQVVHEDASGQLNLVTALPARETVK